MHAVLFPGPFGSVIASRPHWDVLHPKEIAIDFVSVVVFVRLQPLARPLSGSACSAAAAQAGAVIKDKFEPALDASIVRLQNVIEGLCHDLKKQEGKRDAKAGAARYNVRLQAFDDTVHWPYGY